MAVNVSRAFWGGPTRASMIKSKAIYHQGGLKPTITNAFLITKTPDEQTTQSYGLTAYRLKNHHRVYCCLFGEAVTTNEDNSFLDTHKHTHKRTDLCLIPGAGQPHTWQGADEWQTPAGEAALLQSLIFYLLIALLRPSDLLKPYNKCFYLSLLQSNSSHCFKRIFKGVELLISFWLVFCTSHNTILSIFW